MAILPSQWNHLMSTYCFTRWKPNVAYTNDATFKNLFYFCVETWNGLNSKRHPFECKINVKLKGLLEPNTTVNEDRT